MNFANEILEMKKKNPKSLTQKKKRIGNGKRDYEVVGKKP